MSRKSKTSDGFTPDWFLREWMLSLGVTQAELARRCDWPKATASDIFHGKTGYYRKILNEAAGALNVRPFELLMHPQEANQYRTFNTAVRLAAERRHDYAVEPKLKSLTK